MRLNKKIGNFDFYKPTFVCGFLFGVLLFILLIFGVSWMRQIFEVDKFFTGSIAIVQIGVLILACRLFHRNDQGKLQWFFILSLIGLCLDGVAFYVVVYDYHVAINHLNFIGFIVYCIPFILWLVFISLFLMKALFETVVNKTTLLNKFLLFLSFDVPVAVLFFLSLNGTVGINSGVGILTEYIVIHKLFLFSLLMLCILYSNSLEMISFLSGVAIITASGTFLNYAALSGTPNLLIYVEPVWLLGVVLMFLGLFFIFQKNAILVTHFREIENIRNEIAFWIFSFSILFFVLFCLVAYFFKVFDTAMLAGLPFTMMIYSVFIITISMLIGKRFEIPFKKLEANVSLMMIKNNPELIDSSFSIEEFILLQRFITKAYQWKDAEDKAKKQIGETIIQVAHDIRSPLSALNTCLKYLPQIPEEQRILMRNAANRINDIANNLLIIYKKDLTQGSEEDRDSRVWLISPILESIISEKRMQFDGSPTNIVADITSNGFAAFSQFNLREVKRVLSNLINNAVESLKEGDGTIRFSLDANEKTVFLKITDTGSGIPSEKLEEILQRSVSFKEKGSGLGLPHAREVIRHLGGIFDIQSQVAVGTTIAIQLPRIVAPEWFVSELIIDPVTTLLILDDDQSIHDAWRQRLLALSKTLSIQHFKTPESIIEWRKANTDKAVQVFSDYELLGFQQTGLDVLEQLSFGENAILVTSHYENTEILNRCQAKKIKLLPKNLVAHVPMHLKFIETLTIKTQPHTVQYDLILIDDDETLHQVWQLSAFRAKKKLLTCSSRADFMKVKESLNKKIPIYISILIYLIMRKAKNMQKSCTMTGLLKYILKQDTQLANLERCLG